MKNRITGLFLTLCIIFSLAIPVGAANIIEARNDLSSLDLTTGASIALQKISEGKYSLVTAQNTRSKSQHESIVYAKSLHDGEMLQLSNGAYLGKAEGSNYISLDRIDVDVKDFHRADPVFQEYDISKETLDDIQETISYANEIGNDQLEISLYAINPALTEEITYNGNQYRNTYEEVRNASFKPIDVSGQSTKDKLAAAVKFSLTIAGAAVSNPTLNFVSTGISLFNFYLQTAGIKVAYGTTSDWAYTSMFYDKLVKHTAIKRYSNWMTGCVSQKLWINKASTWAHFQASNSTDKKVDSSINKVFYTKNWSNCYNVAYYNWNTGCVTDPNITMTYGGVRWTFR